MSFETLQRCVLNIYKQINIPDESNFNFQANKGKRNQPVYKEHLLTLNDRKISELNKLDELGKKTGKSCLASSGAKQRLLIDY